ncbi:hypothetical protein [Streptomyces sp. NPDC001985]|uniref:hypothetical protein n=1 Tax=Streptomyces sp. NPDC001985 TaxID=3154406 RepID=UPI0033253BCC
MRQHRELCGRAADPLEIAAGLEARGITDRTAARFRHRDVFSLAEELYARVPPADRPAAAPGHHPPQPARGSLRGALVAALPGVLCALTLAGRGVTDGPPRAALTAAGALAVTAALLLALRHGPLRAPGRTATPALVLSLCTLWLLAFLVYGADLLARITPGGPGGPPTPAPGPLTGLALAVVPAAWCAHLFARRARRELHRGRGLADFTAAVRPLVLTTTGMFLCGLTALLALTSLLTSSPSLTPAALALGALLFPARLLTVHGSARAAARGLAAACAAEALVLALPLAARLPGCGPLAGPAQSVLGAWGTGAVSAVACACAGAGLLVHATLTLSRASAHSV